MEGSIRFKHIELKVAGGVATLMLSSPATNNAITPTAFWELRDALDRVAGDENVRALVFSAAKASDDRFSSGFTPEAHALALSIAPERQPPQLLAGLRVPTVAALFGKIDGPALELALACDLRVASEDATFVFSHVAQGELPAWGGTQRLGRMVGVGRALELILLGETLSAQEALSAALVTRLAPRDELLPETQRIAAAWLQGAPHALAYAKEAVRQGADLPFDHALRLEWDLAVLLETTADRAEGIQAFLEKREPRFKGQ